ncbi:SGL domain-containing protein [Fusarium sp. Ph1]|nr:SGL domain-containing protein [Fusarium sp. Ph1]
MTNTNHPTNTWRIFQDEFRDILGPEPSLQLLLQIDEFPFAHEAGVFLPDKNKLFVTSNQFKDHSGHSGEKTVQVSKISLGGDNGPVKLEKIKCDLIHMANGGVNYQDGILICAQGSATHPSGLFKLQTTDPYEAEPVITTYMGRPFNAVNDAVVHRDGSIWFTDPSYGHDQGYRPKPSLPNAVHRYDPATESIRAVADGLGRPNGICFSPDYSTVYITDTDQVRGQSVDYGRAASIYAFDVIQRHGQPFLANRRLFALADTGIPDGVKCDTLGNVYSGCGDGINTWSPGGVLLGKIIIPGGVANFCFGSEGQLFALNEHRLWRVQLDRCVRGALLDGQT